MATAYALEDQQLMWPARFTADEFLRMEELGAFENRKVELANGEIVEEALPGSEHSWLQARLIFLLMSTARSFKAMAELSVKISDDTVRDFDSGLIHFGAGKVRAVPPSAVLLAVEVSVTTLHTDLHVKAAEYARAGIPEYWVADAGHQVVHVMSAPGEHGYTRRVAVGFEEPLEVPGGGTIVIEREPD